MELQANRVNEFLAQVDPAGHDLDDTLEALSRLGLPPGSGILLALPNAPGTIRLHLSALLLGLVPLLVSPATPAVRISEQARSLKLRAILARRLDPRRFKTGPARQVGDAQAILLTPHPASPGPLAHGVPEQYAPGHVLMSTSGTSGMASACLHTVDALLRNAARHRKSVGLTSDDTILINLPLFYSYAMVAQVLAAYLADARVVVTGPPFSPTNYRHAIAHHGVTHSSITPTIVRRLLPDPGLPGRLRTLTVGGDHLTAREVGDLLSARPGKELYITYGLTEAGPRVATLAAHAEPASRHGSVGLPLPGVRTWLREQGELVVQTDTALVGKIGGGSPDGGLVRPGVLATGDRFHIDDGYLHFLGRLSDVIMVGGEKVSLTTVRQAVATIPGVVHVQLIPLPDVGFDLEVGVIEPTPAATERVREAIGKTLLLAERPRRVLVSPADPAALRK
ncbi:class I adenylate-forming enzyme family protein [Thermomonospora umbrina]|uniref:Acyl-CoA synthetase (AMP-forming)/AMP-acid ligase II n=1 Tax=Thermomonospora umbrina TaxID=111806 RepID=A0A3D9T586_9ACTN|nr:fatty acid--CoA ligase family protein [Thermomonospora umbrina]REF00406.1 acyl-CoA synthetase (AMP-forming)/AMP-acid ligase II [Thermomonospora umbrina]